MEKNWVSLHTHSQYSLFDGICDIRELVSQAAGFGMPAIAISDHGHLGAAIKVFQTCREFGIKPIIGIEAYITTDAKLRGSQGKNNNHILLLAKNNAGYKNLCTLSSLAYQDENFYRKPRIDFNLLDQYGDGLIVSSACLKGEIAEAITKGGSEGYSIAKHIASTYKERFKDDYYLELMFHGMNAKSDKSSKDDSMKKLQASVIAGKMKLSKELGIPTIFTNDCLDGNSIIITEYGAKKIKDINVRDLVLTHTGHFKKVIKIVEKESDKKRIKIFLPSSYNNTPNDMIITEDHAFYAFDNETNTFSWIEAKSLDHKKHRLYFPKIKDKEETTPFVDIYAARSGVKDNGINGFIGRKDYIDNSNSLDFNFDLLSDEEKMDLFYLFGLFIGDGHASKTTNSFSIIVNVDNDFGNRIVPNFMKIFGTVNTQTKYKVNNYRMTNRYLSRFFRKKFYDENGNKIFPTDFYGFESKYKSAIINGMLDADGHINKRSCISFHNTSLSLVAFFQRCMYEHGVYSHLTRCKKNVVKSRYNWESFEKEQYSWTSSISGKIKAFQFLSEYKKHFKHFICPQKRQNSINTKTTKEYVEDGVLIKFNKEYVEHNDTVWDIEVDEDHSFCTNLGIVHNCHYVCQDGHYIRAIKMECQSHRPQNDNADDGNEEDEKGYAAGEYKEFYLKSPELMYASFPQFHDALQRTLEVAEKCNANIAIGKSAKVRLPNFNIPQSEAYTKFKASYADMVGHLDENAAYLTFMSWKGLVERGLNRDPKYIERLKYELAVITKTEYAKYFLIVADYIFNARATGNEVGPGRGSAAGSLMCYCLEITDIDPVEFGISFERFLASEVGFVLEERDFA